VFKLLSLHQILEVLGITARKKSKSRDLHGKPNAKLKQVNLLTMLELNMMLYQKEMKRLSSTISGSLKQMLLKRSMWQQLLVTQLVIL
jgi:hypothetical protein